MCVEKTESTFTCRARCAQRSLHDRSDVDQGYHLCSAFFQIQTILIGIPSLIIFSFVISFSYSLVGRWSDASDRHCRSAVGEPDHAGATVAADCADAVEPELLCLRGDGGDAAASVGRFDAEYGGVGRFGCDAATGVIDFIAFCFLCPKNIESGLAEEVSVSFRAMFRGRS